MKMRFTAVLMLLTSMLGCATAESRDSITVPLSTIREIGAKHPRFAVTLIHMNEYGITPRESRFYWTPVKLWPEDVERFSDKTNQGAFFTAYDREVRHMNELIQAGQLTKVIYLISVGQQPDGWWSITIRVKDEPPSVDPPHKALKLDIGPDGQGGWIIY
jgi:hypothetical protein